MAVTYILHKGHMWTNYLVTGLEESSHGPGGQGQKLENPSARKAVGYVSYLKSEY